VKGGGEREKATQNPDRSGGDSLPHGKTIGICRISGNPFKLVDSAIHRSRPAPADSHLDSTHRQMPPLFGHRIRRPLPGIQEWTGK